MGNHTARLEANAARRAAVEQRVNAQARWQQVSEVAAALREIRAANHFAEQLATAFGDSKR